MADANVCGRHARTCFVSLPPSLSWNSPGWTIAPPPFVLAWCFPRCTFVFSPSTRVATPTVFPTGISLCSSDDLPSRSHRGRIDTCCVSDRCGSTRAARTGSCDDKPTEQPHEATWHKWRPRCAHSDATWKTRSKPGVGRGTRTSVHVAAAVVAWEWSTSAANKDDGTLRRRSETMCGG